jgi:NADPH2:quinone reductase
MPHTVLLDPSTNEPTLTELPSVALAGGDLRVRVSFGALNFWQVMQRRGQVPLATPPALGTEGSGTVVEVAADMQALKVGDRVAWSSVPGSWSTEVVGPAGSFFRVPAGVSDEQAASLLFQGVTAQYLAASSWPLRGGATAVVTAAAGGVGLLLTQLLVARGVEVVAVISDVAKRSATQRAGATCTLLYGNGDLAERVREHAPDGVDAVFDSVGGSVARDLVSALRARGAMVLYGAASGEEAGISSNDLGQGSYYVTRTAGRDYAALPGERADRITEVLRLADEGKLRAEIGGTWSLEEAGAALDALESRATVGKLLLRP